MLDARSHVEHGDVALLTLDALRYDVACSALAEGRTPCLASRLPGRTWEERHSPGSFTYASHQAFFAGFLPTPATPQKSERLFAARFAGSETTGPQTCVFDAPDIVSGFRDRGYRTICIGGVGFFNRRTPLSRTLPDLFEESYWSEEMGTASPISAEEQVRLACELLRSGSPDRRTFLFINFSAIHEPNRLFVPGAVEDTLETHAAALEYVDRTLPPLFDAMAARGKTLCVVCSDHGVAYGEEGYRGHRLAHPVVWTVPYAEFFVEGTTAAAT